MSQTLPRRTVARAALGAAVVVGMVVLVLTRPREAGEVPLALRPTTTSTSSTTTTAPTTTVPPTTVPFDPYGLRPPPAAGDAAGLAGQLLAAETALRDPATTPEGFAEAALAQQVAYRQLGYHPEWEGTVLAALPEGLHLEVTKHAAARREFRAMHDQLSSTLPAWRILPPEPVEHLQAIYLEAGATFGVPWQYLAAINLVETGFGRIRGTSTAGAQGPMQFLPATWAAYGGGGDINDVRDAIFGAARYLAANGGGGDIQDALWNYNHSAHYVLGVELYADLLDEHPSALRALHLWGIWYLTVAGDRYLPVGYDAPAPTPV